DAAVGNGLAAGHPVNNPLAGHKIRVRPIFRPVVAKRGPLVGRRPRSIHTIEPRTWADEPTKKPTPAVAGVGRPTRFQTACDHAIMRVRNRAATWTRSRRANSVLSGGPVRTRHRGPGPPRRIGPALRPWRSPEPRIPSGAPGPSNRTRSCNRSYSRTRNRPAPMILLRQ